MDYTSAADYLAYMEACMFIFHAQVQRDGPGLPTEKAPPYLTGFVEYDGVEVNLFTLRYLDGVLTSLLGSW